MEFARFAYGDVVRISEDMASVSQLQLGHGEWAGDMALVSAWRQGDTLLCTILDSRSVDPRKLCVDVKYYIVHMYSMPYYTYGSTANLLFLGPTVLIYISKERCCNEDLHSVGIFFN